MSVGLGRLAMRRPAGVADADRPAKRRSCKLRLQIFQLALGAPPLQSAVLECRDASGIVAAVFEPLQRGDNRARDRSGPENPDNSTHSIVPLRQTNLARQSLRRDWLDHKSSSAKECESGGRTPVQVAEEAKGCNRLK